LGFLCLEVISITFLFCWCKDTADFQTLQTFAQKSLKNCAILCIYLFKHVAQHKKSDFFVGKSAKKSEHEQIFQKIGANHPLIDPLSDGSPTSKKFPRVSIAQKSLGIDKKNTT